MAGPLICNHAIFGSVIFIIRKLKIVVGVFIYFIFKFSC